MLLAILHLVQSPNSTMPSPSFPKVLTIAGSDSGGGAGIQADLKTFTSLNVYGASVITALTAQNTIGVQDVHIPSAEFIRAQLDSVLSDIGFTVIKTGMLPNESIIREVADAITRYKIPTVIVDPVLVATSGDELVRGNDSINALVKHLFPLATLVTPNLPEAQTLTGQTINGVEDMRKTCMRFAEMGCRNVLLKGGHLGEGENNGDCLDGSCVTDVLYDGKQFQAFVNERIHTNNTHGSGCTLASAIAAHLAKGKDLNQSVADAIAYVHNCIAQSLSIGHGNGPLNHMADVSISKRGTTR